MSAYDGRCWECGKECPGGVCAGPHPDYVHAAAIRARQVLNLDRVHHPLTFTGTQCATVEAQQRYYREVVKPRRRQSKFERKCAQLLKLTREIDELLAAGSSTAREGVERAGVRSTEFAPSSLGGGEPVLVPGAQCPVPGAVVDRPRASSSGVERLASNEDVARSNRAWRSKEPVGVS